MKMKLFGPAILTLLLSLASPLVHAEEAEPEKTEAAAEADKTKEEHAHELKAITVTARKGSEDAREVPFSINVFSGDEMEERELFTLDEVLNQTPGVDVISTMGAGVTTLRMRGVGALQRVSGDDTSVVINVDGLPQSATNATMNVLDVERVEVLKGPQGTLFGRNSEAGAVNIVTRKPTRFLEGYIKGEYGDYNRHLVEGVISGPLTETLSARLAARYSGMENVLHNLRTGEPINSPMDQAFRGTLLWQPIKTTTVTLTVGHEMIKNKDNQFVLRPYGDPPQADQPAGSEANKRVVDRYIGEIKHDFGNAIFTSLTGFAHTDHNAKRILYEGRTYYQLVGMSPDGSTTQQIYENFFNQELRLSSRPGDEIFWVVGANYFHNNRSYDRYAYSDPMGFYPSSPYNADMDRIFKSSSYALFGETTIPLFSRFKLTTGMRYTWEEKRYNAYWRALADNPNPIRTAVDNQALHDNYLTGRVALGYALTDEINLYGVYARGYKSGGFNDEGTNFSNGLPDYPYEAAGINSFETGFKAESSDHRMGLNGALFYNFVKDDHLLTFDSITFATTTENYDTETRGFELEGFWKPGWGLALTAGMAYTDARITSSVAGSSSRVQEGNRIPEVPEWSATVSLSHRLALPDFMGMKTALLSKITNRFVGSRPADPQNDFDLGSYNKLDARVGIQSGNAELYVWCENMLDKRYDLYGYYMTPFMPGGLGAEIGAPAYGRVVGMGLAYYF